MSLFAELKRRNVVRVGAAYAVVAWLLIQLADILLANFGAPDWVFGSLTVLILLGFPIALLLSWAYELTPDGLKRDRDVATEAVTAPGSRRRLDWVIIGALVAVIGVMGFERVRLAGPAADGAGLADAAAPARSIAVLAFDDLSPEGDQGYFAEGISEELLNLLARIDGLKVAARTSSFKFRGADADIRQIGAALNVETVLEGSVRKAGDDVRVTAQLIDVATGYHLWSDTYDRRLANIFQVQDEIAGAIVAALRLRLDIDAATAARTVDTDAYDHYLRGRQLAREPTRAGLLRAIEEYERALAIDPGFAAAHGGIAEAWVWLEDYGGFSASDAFPRAERAARRALELDPASPEANTAVAFLASRQRNYHRARELFERTLELNPNHVWAYNLLGGVLRDLGEADAMIEAQRKAVELDPLSLFMKSRLAGGLASAGREDEAEAVLREILAEEPNNDFAHEELANLRARQGRLADALEEYRFVHFARPGDPYSAARAAILAAHMEDATLAEAWIAAARARGAENRWELDAREVLASWQGDLARLDRIGEARGAHWTPYWRGVAAARREAWPEARAQLLESLRMQGYDAARGATITHVPSLTWLAVVEKGQGLESWREHARAARAVLGRGRSHGLTVVGVHQILEHGLARLAGLEGDREATLAHLRSAVEAGFAEHWFLERDPMFAPWREDPEFRAIVQQLRRHAAAERARLVGRDVMP
jgi:TolB-like protein/Tfp pilus assembly protein PilF/preprotein translocase subunit Sec61beta